ncbi:nibrin [Anoplophora glabripennis]|uniref:nibrin n=1 Tax=Anoplophora glabripennis TaxID=217634 RepID=UPI000873E929|nr:nibrin [Anoplophora glabripennis]
MLLYLQNINNENVFYLTEKDKFLVGRKDCDFLIQDDQSISRKHAIIRLKENKVTVEDCGSKYNTLYKGEKLHPNIEIELAIGDIIQFGVSHSSYSLQKYVFVTTGTCLNNNIKTKLISDLSIIKGKYIDQWTSDCTHLTMEEISLTIKFLHALIDEKLVVKPSYWSKFAERVQKQLPPPNINLYNKPPVAEVLLSKVDLSPNSTRKELFKGKLFVFPKEKDKKRLEDIIKKAGGTSISWEKNSIPLEDIEKSPKEFLIIESGDMTNDPSLNEVIKRFSKQGKRTIPLQEIAISITLCSCERDCNPNFNRVEEVFPLCRPTEPTQSKALAANTESEHFTMRELKAEEKEEPVTVPDTFEPKADESEPCEIFAECEIITEKEIDNRQSVKRINDDKLEKISSKKIKIDNDNISNLQKDKTREQVESDGFISKNISPRKKIKEDKQNESSRDSKANQSIFLNKNRRNVVEQSSPKSNPFKRTKKDSDNITQMNKENPFLLSLGSKKRTNEGSSETSISKRKISDTMDKIFSSTKIENISHNITGLTKISRINKDLMNSTWMSKNVTNVISIENDEMEDHFDKEMKQFIEQFKNTVIVEIMEKMPSKQKILRDHSDVCNGKVNFKIFKKVKPLRPQKIIIGKVNFTSVDPGDTASIADSRREIFSNSDDEAEGNLRVKKKKPKKFLI